MGEEIFGKRASDATADEIKAALTVGEQRGDAVESRGVEIGQRLAQIAHDRIGETVENMGAWGVLRPAVMFGDGVRDRRLDFLMQMRLKVRIALEAELLHHAHDGRRRDAGVLGDRGDATEPGDRIIVEQALGQLLLGTRQHPQMRVYDVRNRLRRNCHVLMLPGMVWRHFPTQS